MSSNLITITTEHPFQCIGFTESLQHFIGMMDGQDGVVIATSQHTTTALIVNELEERLLMDIEQWLNHLAPPTAHWKHNDLEQRKNIPDDEPRNAHAHLQALLLGNHVAINVKHGKPVLGRYQDVILVELDGPRQRKVALQWLSAQ